MLRCSFQFPTSKSKIFPIDVPETLVAALMVVSTKLLFPFWRDGLQHSLRFDWDKWTEAIQEFQDEHSGQTGPATDFSDVTVDRILSMAGKEFDDYLSHVSSFIDRTSKLLFTDITLRSLTRELCHRHKSHYTILPCAEASSARASGP